MRQKVKRGEHRRNVTLAHIFCTLLLLIAFSSANAQYYNFPAEYGFSLLTEKELAKKDSSIHSGIQPYIPFFSPKYLHLADSHRIFKFIHDDPLLDLAFY